MSKIRHHKRIMPSTGRMEAGTFKPDYWQGLQDARTQGFHDLDMVPMCLEARSRDYWTGYRKGYQIRHGHAAPKGLDSMKRSELVALKNDQLHLMKRLVGELGLDLDKYLADGGDLSSLLFSLGAKEA